MHCKAVIFDMDGLLVDTEQISYNTWHQVFTEEGLVLDDNIYFQVIGRTLPDFYSIFRSHYGESLPIETMRNRRIQYANEYIRKHGLPTKPGAIEIVTYLKNNNIPYAIASSSGHTRVEQSLAQANIRELFDVIVHGDQIKKGKPDPEIFLLAANILHVDPKVCVVLEDSKPGIQAASAAGMIPIHIPDMVPPDEITSSLAYKVCHSLHDAQYVIRGLSIS
uniref:HAD family hydrolase n=1 Tax=wastewater metagenome TaxID=527639 RepID=A0A0A8KXR5_9ZZZZ